MDPLAALSLIANVIQVVDAAKKAATACYQFYKLGAPIEHLQTEYVSGQLHQAYSTLFNSMQSYHTLAIPLLKSGLDLSDLCTRCCQTALTLQCELQSLQKSSDGGKREAFNKFVLSKRKAKDIRILEEALAEYQKTLDSRILIDVRQMLAALFLKQDENKAKVSGKLERLAGDISACHTSTADVLRAEIHKAIHSGREDHEYTRQHIQSCISEIAQESEMNASREKKLRKQKQFILESLRYDGIDARKHEISPASAGSFGWIFNDEMKQPWDSFSGWLQADHDMFWVDGKAGSGKSTLMRFIIEDTRTYEALLIWADGKNCSILEFYFWLSGNKFQRSLKGLTSSLLRQIISSDDEILLNVTMDFNSTSEKQTIDNWSVDELKKALFATISSTARTRSYCIFIDGLDEIIEDEDDQHINLIESLAKFEHVKCCVSSRPDNYLQKSLARHQSLRLQDLTKDDVRTCIIEALQSTDIQDRLEDSEVNFNKFMDSIAEKADGVFLWVRFALKSLLRGIRNEDDVATLLERLDGLPSGMENLYVAMWQRLNEDKARYHEEARTYFSFHASYPMSLLQLLIVLDEELQQKYLYSSERWDPQKIAKACETLKVRIRTRCAGLLEVDVDSEHEDSETLLLRNQGSYDKTPRPLKFYTLMTVRFLHRTARDFILSSQAGQAISGSQYRSQEDLVTRSTRARMIMLLHGLRNFDLSAVIDIARSIATLHDMLQVKLMKELKEVCNALHIPGSRRYNIRQVGFWKPSWDFETFAVDYNCLSYVRNFVSDRSNINPRYMGFLFTHTIQRIHSKNHSQLRFARWLVQKGADLTTPPSGTERPFIILLREFLYLRSMKYEWESFALSFSLVLECGRKAFMALKPIIEIVTIETEFPFVLQEASKHSYIVNEISVKMDAKSTFRIAYNNLVKSRRYFGNDGYLPKSEDESVFEIVDLYSVTHRTFCLDGDRAVQASRIYKKLMEPGATQNTRLREEFYSCVSSCAVRSIPKYRGLSCDVQLDVPPLALDEQVNEAGRESETTYYSDG